MSNYLMPHW
uniref:Uncharacterized protein n=1 Tax=Anguilla anguilla TaxID=7936 RepID=A0A0E9TMR1_ANGAN